MGDFEKMRDLDWEGQETSDEHGTPEISTATSETTPQAKSPVEDSDCRYDAVLRARGRS